MRVSPARRMPAGVVYFVRSTTATLTMAQSNAALQGGEVLKPGRRKAGCWHGFGRRPDRCAGR
jgi:hypothetical protein